MYVLFCLTGNKKMLIETHIWRSRQDEIYSKIRIYYWYVKHTVFCFRNGMTKLLFIDVFLFWHWRKNKINSKENNMLTFTTHFQWSITSTIDSTKYQNRTRCFKRYLSFILTKKFNFIRFQIDMLTSSI